MEETCKHLFSISSVPALQGFQLLFEQFTDCLLYFFPPSLLSYSMLMNYYSVLFLSSQSPEWLFSNTYTRDYEQLCHSSSTSTNPCPPFSSSNIAIMIPFSTLFINTGMEHFRRQPISSVLRENTKYPFQLGTVFRLLQLQSPSMLLSQFWKRSLAWS